MNQTKGRLSGLKDTVEALEKISKEYEKNLRLQEMGMWEMPMKRPTTGYMWEESPGKGMGQVSNR